MIRIVPDQPSYPPDGPPPRFRVGGGGHHAFSETNKRAGTVPIGATGVTTSGRGIHP